MLKSCGYCGRIHDSKFDCGRKPVKRYRRSERVSGRYTRDWSLKAEEIKERSRFLCACCLAEGRITYDGLEVHHIVPLRVRPELLLEDGNLVCLCRRHHEMAERGDIDAQLLRELARERDDAW